MITFSKEQIAALTERGVMPKFIQRAAQINPKDLQPTTVDRENVCRMVANGSGSVICEADGPDQDTAFQRAFDKLLTMPMVNYDDPAKQLADSHAEIARLRQQLEQMGRGNQSPAVNQTQLRIGDQPKRKGRPPKFQPANPAPATTPTPA